MDTRDPEANIWWFGERKVIYIELDSESDDSESDSDDEGSEGASGGDY